MRYSRYSLLLLALLALFHLTACSQQTASTYAENSPPLVLEDFFNGKLIAHGVLKNRSGKVTRRFVAELQAHTKDNGQIILDETFLFDDGEQQQRTWTITPKESSEPGIRNYVGTAPDVTGQADIAVSGNAMFLNYVLQVPYKGKTLELAVDDRMYLIDDQLLINESTLSKWGFDVGELILSIRKLD